jgi:CMP-N,N'-diacetyllegionaminic acid synthase
MIAGKRILIVVPARGGSKGLPLKNLCKVGGMTLVAWTARVIKSLPWVDRAVVSTDYEEIAAEAESAGLAAPFRRPRAISGDIIGDADVLIHALQEMERIDDHNYDVVAMLPPTCPLRQPSHVTATVEMLVGKQLDAVWTVSPTDLKFHPLKQLVVSDNGRMTLYDPAGAHIIARQQLSQLYHRNGAAYAISRACLLEHSSIIGPRSGAVIIRDILVNIDTTNDLVAAERHITASPYHLPLCCGDDRTVYNTRSR